MLFTYYCHLYVIERKADLVVEAEAAELGEVALCHNSAKDFLCDKSFNLSVSVLWL